MGVPTSTRRSSSSVMASRETASCGGTATKTRAPGSSGAGPNTPSPCPRVTATSGTEPPSNSNSTTALTTPATGKWTFTSENPLTRCPLLTSSNSSPRPGIPSPTTGTSTRERKSNSPLTTRLSKELIWLSPRKRYEHLLPTNVIITKRRRVDESFFSTKKKKTKKYFHTSFTQVHVGLYYQILCQKSEIFMFSFLFILFITNL